MRTVKYLVFIVLVIYAVSSCNGKKEKVEDESSTSSIDSVELVNAINPTVNNIQDFLLLKNKPNAIEINSDLFNGLEVREFSKYLSAKDSSEYFVFSLKNKNNIVVGDYRIIVRTFPFDSDLSKLRDDSRERSLHFDSWSSNLKIDNNEIGDFFKVKIKSEIKEFREVQFLLYDKNSKKYVGNKITIETELEKYLQERKKQDGEEVDTDIGGVFPTTEFFAHQVSNSDGAYFILKLKNELSDEVLKNNRIVLKTFPYEDDLDLLREDSKSKNAKHDSWYIDPSLISNTKENYVYVYVKTEITEFNKVELRVYDKLQKRYVGLPQTFENFFIN